MKNIHLISTDKGQRITKTNKGTFLFCSVVAKDFIETRKDYLGFHLYITFDEEIKEGDWFLFLLFKGGYKIKKYNSEKHFAQEPCISLANLKAKKIILTTDQDLIKDGIQEIEDGFLEWFVKNPSCEKVEIEKIDTFKKTNEVYVDEITGGNYYEIIKKSKIIIPREEVMKRPNQYSKPLVGVRTENYHPQDLSINNQYANDLNTYIDYLEMQQKRMYSEEEVLDIINSFEKLCYNYQNNKDWFPAKKSEWFTQFKKK